MDEIVRTSKTLFIIFYTIGLVYLIYQTYKTWQTPFVTVYISLTGIWIAGVTALSRIFDWIFHENTKDREKYERYVMEHSQDLVNTVLKEWLKDTRLLKHSDKRQQAIEHLRKGYPTVCNLLIEHENLRMIYSESYANTRDFINIKLIKKAPTQFVDFNPIGITPLTYFDSHIIVDLIHTEAKHFLKYGELIGDIEIKRTHHLYILHSLLGKIAQSDKKESIDDFKTVLDGIITDKFIIELTKLCEVRKNEFDTNTNIVNRELSIIIDNVIEGHHPLKDTCYRCEGWHKELDSLI